MRNLKIKKYTLHILSLAAANAEAFDLPKEKNAVICVADNLKNFSDYAFLKHILVMPFRDAEDKNESGAFQRAHARMIIRFLKKIGKDVTDLYVICSKGGSRSPAIAAAVLKMSGRSDKKVWQNPYYVPNILVYKRLCLECGLFFSALTVPIKRHINNRAFRKCKKNGGSELERWELLF